MGSTLTNRLAPMLLAGIVIFLSCSVVFAQLADNPPAQPDKDSAQKDPSQLHGAPGPGSAASASEPGGTAQPQDSSSSPSAPDNPPHFFTSTDPNAQVTVLENTLLRVITNAPLRTGEIRENEELLFTLDNGAVVDGVLIVPRGAILRGTVVQTKRAGKLTGSPDLILKPVSLDLGGRRYPIYTYQFKVEGTSKSKPTEEKVKAGAVIGAIAGLALDGSARGATTAAGKLAGMGTGAALGAGVGTAVSAVTPGPVVDIPAESQIDFYLSSPISVVPVRKREADRLSEGLRAGGPVLYVRGETP